jgi:uncharacterized membrane protein YqjE
MIDKATKNSKGLIGSLATIATLLVSTAYTRLELISIEIEENRERLLSLLTLYLVSYFSLMVGIVLLTIMIVVAFWDTYRLSSLALLSGFFLLIGFTTWWIANSKSKTKPKIFTASLLELLKDYQKLDSP